MCRLTAMRRVIYYYYTNKNKIYKYFTITTRKLDIWSGNLANRH